MFVIDLLNFCADVVVLLAVEVIKLDIKKDEKLKKVRIQLKVQNLIIEIKAISLKILNVNERSCQSNHS